MQKNRVLSIILAFVMLLMTGHTAIASSDADNSEVTEESALQSVADMKEKLAELDELFAQCRAEKISTDYEDLRYTIIQKFIDCMEEDIKNKDLTRIRYTEKCLIKLYDEAKQNLQGYLAGTVEPLDAPTYAGGDLAIDGVSLMGDMEYQDGTVVNQPVFMVGYGHSVGAVQSDLPIWSSLGMNNIALELGPSGWMSEMPGWTVKANKSPDYSVKLTDETSVSGRSMHVVYKSEEAANRYITIRQNIPVEPNTTYRYSMNLKGTVGHVWFYVDQRSGTKRLTEGEYSDWTDFSGEYTSGADVTEVYLSILVDTEADFYLDNLSFCKANTAEETELLANGDFESGADEPYGIGIDYRSETLQKVLKTLEIAEENNISVTMLLSPHYFVDSLYEKYDGLEVANNLFLYYDINHPVAKSVVERHIRALVPILKQYSCVSNIILTNEPSFKINLFPESYQEQWEEYLSSAYDNDIGKLNRTYGTEYTAFAGIPMPQTNTADAPFYDYNQFQNGVFSAWHEWMANIVHEIWAEIPVSAKIMGQYAALETKLRRRLLDGVNAADFAAFTQLNGNDYGLYLSEIKDGTGEPLEESFWYDLQRGTKEMPVANTEDHMIANGEEDFSDEQQYHFGTGVWQGAVHGRAWSTIWKWQRSTDTTSNSWLSILYRPDCVFQVSKATMDLNRLANEVTAIQNRVPKVAILVSDNSRIYSRAYMNALYQTYAATMYNGVSMKFVYDREDQIAKIRDANILIIPAAYQVTDSTVEEVESFVKQGGKVVTIGDANKILAYDEHNRQRTDSATDYIRQNVSKNIPATLKDAKMTVPTRDELRKTLGAVYQAEGLMNVVVTDAVSGQTIDGIEWESAEYNGNTVINMVNTNLDAPQTVNVYINGELVTDALELRDNLELGESWTLEPFQPILIQTKLTTAVPATDYDPTGVMVSERSNAIHIGWKNPKAAVESVKLYHVVGEEATELLPANNLNDTAAFSTASGASNLYAHDLTGGTIGDAHLYKLVFNFQDGHTKREYYIAGELVTMNGFAPTASKYKICDDNNKNKTVWLQYERDRGTNDPGKRKSAGQMYVDLTEGYSGNASLKIVTDHSEIGGMVYSELRTATAYQVTTKPNTQYKFSAWVKKNNANSVNIKYDTISLSLADPASKTGTGDKADWEYYEKTFTQTATEDKNTDISINCNSVIDELWIDDIRMVELDAEGNEVGENLVTYGGFEELAEALPLGSGIADAKAEAKYDGVVLTWKNPDNANYWGTRLYQVIGGKEILMGEFYTDSLTSVTIPGLTAQKEYTYKIAAFDKNKTETSGTTVKAKVDYQKTVIGAVTRANDGSFCINVKNNTVKDGIDGKFIVAFYETNDNGEEILTEVCCDSQRIERGNAYEYRVALQNVTGKSGTAYAFLWNGWDALKPLIDRTEFVIE